MRTRFRREMRGDGKLERTVDWRRQHALNFEGKKLDFFRGREGLGRLFFLLFSRLDRMAHRARVLAVEGFFRAGENGSVLRGVGPDHVCPRHGLEDTPMAPDDEKQRNRGNGLAAGCEKFLSERGHSRGDSISRKGVST